MKHTEDPYILARRANLAAAERGEFQTAEMPVHRVPEVSEVYNDKPKGWRRFFIKVRRLPTHNTRMARILPTPEEIEGTR